MIRLFVAIDLPEWIKADLETLCFFGIRGVKWVDPEQFHLSLKFIGEVDESLFGNIEDCLSKINNKSFSLNLSQVGLFPNGKAPRVIWAGVDKNEDLMRLQKKVETQLNRLNLRGDKRKYSPHITLGRVKSQKPGRIGDFMIHNNLFKSGPFEVDRFTLFSSMLTPKGPIYRKEKEFYLRQ